MGCFEEVEHSGSGTIDPSLLYHAGDRSPCFAGFASSADVVEERFELGLEWSSAHFPFLLVRHELGFYGSYLPRTCESKRPGIKGRCTTHKRLSHFPVHISLCSSSHLSPHRDARITHPRMRPLFGFKLFQVALAAFPICVQSEVRALMQEYAKALARERARSRQFAELFSGRSAPS
jgi:hypothetical protein